MESFWKWLTCCPQAVQLTIPWSPSSRRKEWLLFTHLHKEKDIYFSQHFVTFVLEMKYLIILRKNGILDTSKKRLIFYRLTKHMTTLANSKLQILIISFYRCKCHFLQLEITLREPTKISKTRGQELFYILLLLCK